MYRVEAPAKLQLAPVTWNALSEHFLVTTSKNKGTEREISATSQITQI